jgi:hypothetical protein
MTDDIPTLTLNPTFPSLPSSSNAAPAVETPFSETRRFRAGGPFAGRTQDG